MKRHALILTVASLAVLLTGCQNPDGTQNNTGSGALIGGAMGAVTGAAIGGRRNGAEDAALGMAAGAVAGGLMGFAVDRDQEARLKAQAPQTYVRVDQGQPLSVADVKALARAGINEDVIINQIRASHTVYHLSAADIVDLRDSGVTNNVNRVPTLSRRRRTRLRASRRRSGTRTAQFDLSRARARLVLLRSRLDLPGHRRN